MPLTLFHGDSVDDDDPWCPVCFDLRYENLDEGYGKRRMDSSKANDANEVRKGAMHGYSLWWRAVPDLQQRAEQHACIYCAVLLQIIHRFWKQPTQRQSPRELRVYRLKVFKNGSVEIMDMADIPRSPLALLLFTPSGTE